MSEAVVIALGDERPQLELDLSLRAQHLVEDDCRVLALNRRHGLAKAHAGGDEFERREEIALEGHETFEAPRMDPARKLVRSQIGPHAAGADPLVELRQ